MKAHPYANILPLLEGPAFDELVADIRTRGLVHPIVLFDGQILDGRNRYAACKVAKLDPKTEMYTGKDPLGYVIATNLKRRHLSESQRAMVAARLADMKQGARTDLAPIGGTSQSDAADRLNVGERTLQRARAVLDTGDAALIASVDRGEVAVSAAIREIKRADVVAKLESVSEQQVKALSGVYDVIVLDPPWPMQRIERDGETEVGLLDYPTMSEGELAKLRVPCAESAHVWLWTTQRFLPMAFRLLEGWGLKYVCQFTWHKPGGFQPFDLPQYNAEHALYARRGSPPFVSLKDFPICFDAPRGKHSEKPERFYDIVRRVTRGRRLDMFNRRHIEGFDGWGNQCGAAKAVAS